MGPDIDRATTFNYTPFVSCFLNALRKTYVENYSDHTGVALCLESL